MCEGLKIVEPAGAVLVLAPWVLCRCPSIVHLPRQFCRSFQEFLRLRVFDLVPLRTVWILVCNKGRRKLCRQERTCPMCMTLEALLVFLNIIGPEMVESRPGLFIVHAEQGPVRWVETESNWCTIAPQLDRIARF